MPVHTCVYKSMKMGEYSMNVFICVCIFLYAYIPICLPLRAVVCDFAGEFLCMATFLQVPPCFFLWCMSLLIFTFFCVYAYVHVCSHVPCVCLFWMRAFLLFSLCVLACVLMSGRNTLHVCINILCCECVWMRLSV